MVYVSINVLHASTGIQYIEESGKGKTAVIRFYQRWRTAGGACKLLYSDIERFATVVRIKLGSMGNSDFRGSF